MSKQNKENVGGRVVRGVDGKYRWAYEVNLLKNPMLYFLVWKILFFILVGIFAVLTLIDAVEWRGSSLFAERMLGDLRFFGYFVVGMTALSAMGYLLYAAFMGGKYIAEFEMDDEGVLHSQNAAQAKKVKKIGAATAVLGTLAGRVSTVGVGLNAQRTQMYTEFSRVRKVKAYPARDLIKVNERFGHNQVYAAPEDFAFVRDHILSRCRNVKRRADDGAAE
ncbi:MAG: hypothetical protein IJT44_06595 [Clostridia bacterium]|nr:hypothetical protein [Clostridia bacterium]